MAEVGKIFNAIHSILGALEIEKGGVLPSNMGGKSYATAEEISRKVKEQLAAHNVIMAPTEEVVHREVLVIKDRITSVITIRGTYTFMHVEDGSTVRISGIGDGIATGTAVASNIASTFALKNALQRFFLVSEDAVETGALNEQAPARTPANRRIEEAGRTAPKPPAKGAATSARDEIRKDWIDTGRISREKVNEIWTQLKTEGKSWDDVLAELKANY